ncbi:helix-turn-helix domain-containing protein [Paenibacillus sp. CGMCC 1.16610]|uniref:Helix-turn-helix domain-containing protein n=1 Tax=Paenibacillus anseongense TaxID=2682845 RepID=A0ABW9U8F4_9BACL|nr:MULTISPECIES: helix-turn-helix transcriptional regulator [Paenibacillus]MBA2938682.1 helix-turn-helix domain-containing protein [Paenibacillus sp. CGMCC 1.16610]MVQ34645.1 helix-turn-helix domain-containing protein [Paenibacillus anseongense]
MREISSSLTLGEFLRARRERLTPEEVGLPSYGRRRTPGLRREEVAHLAHIGTSWYTSLEQDREVNPSTQVLDSIAEALKLSVDEQRHLHMLARIGVAKETEQAQEVSLGLERMLKALEPNPAFILGRNWDMLMWNQAAEIVFHLPALTMAPGQRPNWLRRFLTDASLQTNNPDWEAKAQVMMARFRADYAHFPHDERFRLLIEEFMEISELFRSYWPLHDVQIAVDCHKRWIDPSIGKMEFEHLTLETPQNPYMKTMIYMASPATCERLKYLLSVNSLPMHEVAVPRSLDDF